ncbi:helix-turn-helix domain-containing protein [Bacteroides sp.]
METEELQNLNVHHGHNIRRIRIEKGIKQDAMAKLMNLSRPAVSKYEQTKVIDDEMLHRFSKALDVPVEYLKALEENAPSVVFENITNDVHDNNDSVVNSTGYANVQNATNIFNPIDKITELYERLLKEKDEKYAALEQRIKNLEQQK